MLTSSSWREHFGQPSVNLSASSHGRPSVSESVKSLGVVGGLWPISKERVNTEF